MSDDARRAAPLRDEMSHSLARPEGRVPKDSLGSQPMETILMVDDEPDVLALATEVLRAHSYTVVATGDPREALRIARARPEPLHLLLMDVVMPWISWRAGSAAFAPTPRFCSCPLTARRRSKNTTSSSARGSRSWSNRLR